MAALRASEVGMTLLTHQGPKILWGNVPSKDNATFVKVIFKV